MKSRWDLLQSGYLNVATHGFTLIELLIVMAVMSILLAIAMPGFNDIVLSSKLGSYANNLIASSYLARSEAIKRNASVTLCASSDGINCAASGGWEQGWIVLIGTTVIQRQPALPSDFRISQAGGLGTLSYLSTGLGTTQASLKICRSSPSPGNQERVVAISASGRPSVVTTQDRTCP